MLGNWPSIRYSKPKAPVRVLSGRQILCFGLYLLWGGWTGETIIWVFTISGAVWSTSGFFRKKILGAEDPVLPFMSASKYLATKDWPILFAKYLDALMKVLLDPLYPEIKFTSMQRITIEGFLIQYDPLHHMQYKDPLHPSVGSSASTGCGKKEGCGYSWNYTQQRSFRAPNFEMGHKSQYNQLWLQPSRSRGQAATRVACTVDTWITDNNFGKVTIS